MDFDSANAINQAIRLLCIRHRARAAALLAPHDIYPGQEALLLELERSGPSIQAQLGEALGCEPPSVTLMARKLESAGLIRRTTAPSDKRATIVELTPTGKRVVNDVKELWCALAEETIAGLPQQAVKKLPETLNAMSANVDK